jgi:hypothetical protein
MNNKVMTVSQGEYKTKPGAVIVSTADAKSKNQEFVISKS